MNVLYHLRPRPLGLPVFLDLASGKCEYLKNVQGPGIQAGCWPDVWRDRQGGGVHFLFFTNVVNDAEFCFSFFFPSPPPYTHPPSRFLPDLGFAVSLYLQESSRENFHACWSNMTASKWYETWAWKFSEGCRNFTKFWIVLEISNQITGGEEKEENLWRQHTKPFLKRRWKLCSRSCSSL